MDNLPNLTTINEKQLAEILAGIKGAKPIGFSALTEVPARKLDNPYGQLHKLAKYNAFTGANWSGIVSRQQKIQGQPHPRPFKANPHSWAERAGPALYVHPQTGQLYLATYLLRPCCRPTYLYQRSFGSWSPVEKSKIEQFLPADRRYQDAERQGLVEPVSFRNYKLSSIVSLNVDGKRYRVRRNSEGESVESELPFP